MGLTGLVLEPPSSSIRKSTPIRSPRVRTAASSSFSEGATKTSKVIRSCISSKGFTLSASETEITVIGRLRKTVM